MVAMASIVTRSLFVTGMGGSRIDYHSAKDQVRWHGLKPKDYMHDVIEVAAMCTMSEDHFAMIKSGTPSSTMLTGDDIDKIAKAKNGSKKI